MEPMYEGIVGDELLCSASGRAHELLLLLLVVGTALVAFGSSFEGVSLVDEAFQSTYRALSLGVLFGCLVGFVPGLLYILIIILDGFLGVRRLLVARHMFFQLIYRGVMSYFAV